MAGGGTTQQGCSLGLERLVSSRLGLEDITSRSRSGDFSLVEHPCNNGSDPQETGCQVTDFTS